jgi:L-alanine-DL-glutamate epimerase-like enolase superfamily enzyme
MAMKSEEKGVPGTDSRDASATIERLEACHVRVPLAQSTAFSTRTVVARDYVLVRLRTDDGIEGLGFCYGGSSAGSLVATAVRDLLRPVVLGKNSHLVEHLWADMYQESLLQGRVGAVMRALSAIDIALWDRNAKASRLPLYKFLGAVRGDRVPAYASGGYYVAGKTDAMLAREAVGYVERGFSALKIKIGRLDERAEERRLAVVREAVGPDVLVMMDANNAWSDVPTALRFVRRYEPYDPYFIEEPFGPDDVDAHARLAELTTIPVATGEIEAGRWRFKELIEKRAALILQPDAAVCGGVTEFRRIAGLAAANGTTLMPHWFHDLHVHLTAATPNATYVEFFPDDLVLNFRRLLDSQLEFRDGCLILPDRPGLGFDFDAREVAKYALGPWS